MLMDHERTLEELKQTLQARYQAFEKLESALVEFEKSISGEASLHPKSITSVRSRPRSAQRALSDRSGD
jgi:hypothetical protein